MANILIVEDEKKMQEIIVEYMQRGGHICFTADDGIDALVVLKSNPMDLMILDIMMTNLDGFSVCKIAREMSNLPIIMLTAKGSEDDKLKGYDLGADDYMTKPFSMKQLLARVEAISRRFSNSNKPLAKVFKYDDLVVDCSKMEVFLNGKFISVTPIEWRILSSMIQNQRKVYTRDELLTIAFGTDYDGFDRSVDTHIKNLRKKLGDDPRKSTYIHTVHGIGYRFGGEV